MLSLFAIATPALADGDDSSAGLHGRRASTSTPRMAGQSGDEVTFTAAAGEVVTAVCIKSGNDAFGPDKKHSDLITADGTVGDGCYTVAGIGTQTVTVTRTDDSRLQGHQPRRRGGRSLASRLASRRGVACGVA